MPCERIGNAIICSNPIVDFKGFKIEFPKIGSPVMLTGEFEIVEYEDTPKEFWDAVEEYQYREKTQKQIDELLTMMIELRTQVFPLE